MFLVYRDSIYSQEYKVCYFTELDEHNKEVEFNKALAGEPFYDGFLLNASKRAAKKVIAAFIERLNNGDEVDSAEIDKALEEFNNL